MRRSKLYVFSRSGRLPAPLWLNPDRDQRSARGFRRCSCGAPAIPGERICYVCS
jgi:hypothetical protein